MTEPEAVQPAADRRAVHADLVVDLQLQAQLVQRQIALRRQPRAHPILEPAQLAGAAEVALSLRRQAAGRAAQLDHVVDELRRHSEATRRLAMRMALVDKGDDTLAQLNGMWLAHARPQHLRSTRRESQNRQKGNH